MLRFSYNPIFMDLEEGEVYYLVLHMEVRNITMTIRVTVKERDCLKDLARGYTAGNVSAWLRYAGVSHVPLTADLVQVVKK